MASLGAVQVAATGQASRHHLHVPRVHGVVPSANYQRRHRDVLEVSDSVPAGERGLLAHPEFARPLHRNVDLGVDVRETALHRVRPAFRWHPQRVVLVVMRTQQLHIARVLDVAGRLEGLDLGQHALVHRRHQDLLRVGRVRRSACHHVRDHQSAQVLLVSQGVLDRQDPAPRLTVEDEVLPAQAKGPANLLHFVHEAIQLPQGRVVRLVAESGAELVVVVVLNPRGRKVTVARLQVLVGGSGAAVQQQHLHIRVVTHPLGPYGEPAAGSVDGNAANPAAQPVRTPRVIEIAIDRAHAPPPHCPPDIITPAPWSHPPCPGVGEPGLEDGAEVPQEVGELASVSHTAPTAHLLAG
jgi:hypothetical protein